MPEHSPEPWTPEIGPGHSVWSGGDLVADILSDRSAEDEQRIIACINACAGLSNEQLELVVKNLDRE